MTVIGIRREDKSVWERRTPLVPPDVERLVREHGIEFHVQRSPRRCFPDGEFARAGARLTEDLRGADLVLGVKEIPPDLLERGKTYLFFSHTIKGQPYNMPMLRRILELGCTLLDYELVADDDGIRTIAFGRHAGLAGAIDTLWALGRRLAARGIETPFARLSGAVEYGEVAKARREIEEAGRAIAREGWPEEIAPLTIGVTGAGGKVSGGALEVLEELPSRRVEPEDLAGEVRNRAGRPSREVLVVSYGPEHLVEPVRAGAEYSWEHYVRHPGEYRSRFAPHLARLTALIHGIFWKEGYPRFLLREDLARLWSGEARPKLEVITDVTCDVGGSNESLVRVTDPGSPAYVYDPASGTALDGWEGPGPSVLAVDILPAEIPVDASRHFSECLAPLLPALARGTPDPGDEALPPSLRRAILAHRGRLLPRWERELAGPLRRHGSPPEVGAKRGEAMP